MRAPRHERPGPDRSVRAAATDSARPAPLETRPDGGAKRTEPSTTSPKPASRAGLMGDAGSSVRVPHTAALLAAPLVASPGRAGTSTANPEDEERLQGVAARGRGPTAISVCRT